MNIITRNYQMNHWRLDRGTVCRGSNDVALGFIRTQRRELTVMLGGGQGGVILTDAVSAV